MELIDSLRILCGELRWRRDIMEWQVESLVLSCASSNDALEKLKSDYLQLFMDRDLVLKFVEDKEREVEELHYQLSVALSSPLTAGTPSSLAVVTQEGVSVKHDVREEPLMMSLDEEHSELQVLEESLDCTLIWHCGGQEPFILESSLEGQSLATKEMVEHLPCGPAHEEAYASMDWVDRYMMDMDTLWGTGLVIISRVLGPIVAHTWHQMIHEDTMSMSQYTGLYIGTWWCAMELWSVSSRETS
jgi:hypothetical protein